PLLPFSVRWREGWPALHRLGVGGGERPCATVPPTAQTRLPSSIFHLPPFSESFSCILYTEFSESWTAASFARMVDRVRVSISDDSNAMLPILKSRDSPRRVKETPTSLINPPALRAT